MKDILDAPFQTRETSPPTFSRLAFGIAILEISIIIYIMASIPVVIKASDSVSMDESLIVPFRILVVLGTLGSIISIARKEDSVYLKWIAACINFVLMLFFVYSIIHVYFLR